MYKRGTMKSFFRSFAFVAVMCLAQLLPCAAGAEEKPAAQAVSDASAPGPGTVDSPESTAPSVAPAGLPETTAPSVAPAGSPESTGPEAHPSDSAQAVPAASNTAATHLSLDGALDGASDGASDGTSDGTSDKSSATKPDAIPASTSDASSGNTSDASPGSTSDENFDENSDASPDAIPDESPLAPVVPYVRKVMGLASVQLFFLNDDSGTLDPLWLPLLLRLAQDGYAPEHTLSLFAALGPQSYTPAYMGAKIAELFGVGGIGINREKSPPPVEPDGYFPPVPDATAGSCLAFMRDNDAIFQDIKERHGVDRGTLIALLLIETAFGKNLGQDRALRVLASMAATNSAAMLGSMGNQAQVARLNGSKLNATLKQRSNWAYKELIALLDFGLAAQRNIASMPSSSMGAIGLCQFMPSNIGLFGVDGDKDGVVNLFFSTDALYSAANYLEAHGWRQAKSDSQKHRVFMAYNHDAMYASYVAATAKRVDRALQGKLRPGTYLVAGGFVPSARLDPSLRRLKPVPRKARVNSLGSYHDLLR